MKQLMIAVALFFAVLATLFVAKDVLANAILSKAVTSLTGLKAKVG